MVSIFFLTVLFPAGKIQLRHLRQRFFADPHCIADICQSVQLLDVGLSHANASV
jgi:hypothetical protein